ncbi:HIT family protein [Thermoleophilia bacterium SCSIO 60948]|nr:HIT family protein [Thermoleophilia bacterium SCSIO 60948]
MRVDRALAKEPFDSDCEFCNLSQGGEPESEVIASREEWLAIFPLAPAARGHTLVLPRGHFPDFFAVSRPLSASLFEAIQEVGHALERVLECEGINLITSRGRAAEQSVFHLHFHLVPRWQGDSFGPIWPSRSPVVETSALAHEIRQDLG